MRIVTWNINSVRLRLSLLQKLIDEENPDVICLQETKVPDHLFPQQAIMAMGYEHVVFKGEKGYNGVAIISKIPLSGVVTMQLAQKDDARHISAVLPNSVELHNFYVPAGGDEPDVSSNPKFKHKLDFVEEMTTWFGDNRTKDDSIIILGDFNIAPQEHDVWSHKQLRNTVSHTEPEISRIIQLKDSIEWIDTGRFFTPDDEKLYSWWSYRNRDWKKSNRGRRLDHIWTTPALRSSLQSYKTVSVARDWEKPSDHVPVVLDIS